MKKKLKSQSGFFSLRVLVSSAFCSIGVFLLLLAFSLYPGGNAFARQDQAPAVVQQNAAAPEAKLPTATTAAFVEEEVDSPLILPSAKVPSQPDVVGATFVVNTTNDTADAAPGDGACLDAAGACSLRAAITEANALAGPDTITLPAGTYTTTLVAANEDLNAGGDFDIRSDVTINGAGAASTIIQANAAPNTATEKVIHITTNSTAVAINDVTIRNGNSTVNTLGGGVRIDAVNSVTNLTNCIITANRVTNPVNAFAGGLGITAGSVTLTGCTVSGNSAVSTGAAAGNNGFAGGIYNQQATVNLVNSTVTGNFASSFHGGIRTLSQTIVAVTNITNSTVSNNQSQGQNTAGGPGEGGGVVNISAGALGCTTNITASTINGNAAQVLGAPGVGTAAGGIENFSVSTGPAAVNVTNSTISGNTAEIGGGGYSDGAVATMNYKFSTIASNSATGSGGGLYQDVTAGGVTNLKDCIVADNTATTAGNDIFGTITSQNYNHLESTAGGTFAAMANDVVAGDPALGALANNGGPTFTHLPGGASVVLNTIPNGTNECGSISVDQRALGRPSGAGCEKGSVEVQIAPTPTPSPTPTTTVTPSPSPTVTPTPATPTPTPTVTPSPTPTATATGTASATATASASATPCGASVTFTNSALITIPATGTGATTGAPANPYPSNIAVAGLSGAITKVTVALSGVAHSFPDDIDILLVAPGGQTALLMSDVGGDADVTGVNLVLDDDAAANMPDGNTLVSGTFKPTNIGGADAFPAPAPAPGASLLSVFNGTAPNGTWALYVVDDAAIDIGSIASGWSITITTGAGCGTPTPSPTATASATPSPATPTPSATATASPSPTCPPGLTEGFDDITALPAAGWVQTNHSTTIGTTGWFQGNDAVFPAHQGTLPNSYIGANFNNTTGTNTISNWLLTPAITLQNGASMTFWTRTTTANPFPDRLQVRMSTAGNSTNVGTTATDVGDFTTLLLDINPTYIVGGYPEVWTLQTVTITGVPSATLGRLAFRYFVENGGPTGANSNYIGIDTFAYNGPCGGVTPTPSVTATASASATPGTPSPTATCAAGGSSPGPWATAAPLPPVRYRGGSATDGTFIYVFGGGNSTTTSLNDLWRWDPATQTWTQLANMPTGKQNIQGACWNGKIYVPGGFIGTTATHTTENAIYDIASNTWSTGAPLPAAQTGTNVAFNNKIYNFGGNPGPQATVTIYDIATNSWSAGAAMPVATTYGRAATTGGFAYYVGGIAAATTNAVHRYNFAANTWTTMAPLGTARTSAEVMASPDGSALFAVMGGDATFFTGVPQAVSMEIYNIAANTWALGPPVVTKAAAPSGALAGGKLMVQGGTDGAGVFLNTVQVSVLQGGCASPPSITPTPAGTPTPTLTPSPTITPTPSTSPSQTPTFTPTPSPTLTPMPTLTPSPTPATQAINLSTRTRVQTGNNVSIGGFIITGTTPMRVIIRAIGPSLTGFGIVDVLADPVLELHGPCTFTTLVNNNWRDTQEAEIQATGIPPTNDFESAILVTLNPGAYTGILRGNGNASGVALFEVYDLSQLATSKLANLSTRAFVGTADNIIIAGFLLGSNSGGDSIVVRGIGPGLAAFGVPTVLADPTLELRDHNGSLLISNNDWQDNPAQAAEIIAAGLAPTSNLEAAIAATLPPGLYTALLAGLSGGAGNGAVEVYDRGDGSGTPPPPPPACPSPTPQTPSPTPASSPTPPPGATPTPSPAGPCVENFDGVTAPALPAGWTSTNPADPSSLWVTSPTLPDTPPNDAVVKDQDAISDTTLDSRNIAVNSAAAQITFRNNFNTQHDPPPAEVFWDGYVMEVSVNGGAFVDVTNPSIGGTFVTGGYTGVIDGTRNNPLAGRMAWSGNSGGYINTVINLGAALHGQTIKLRFRMGTDNAVAAPGVRIDTISITGAACP